MITDTFKDLVVKLLVVTLKSSVLECSSARELVNSYDWLICTPYFLSCLDHVVHFRFGKARIYVARDSGSPSSAKQRRYRRRLYLGTEGKGYRGKTSTGYFRVVYAGALLHAFQEQVTLKMICWRLRI